MNDVSKNKNNHKRKRLGIIILCAFLICLLGLGIYFFWQYQVVGKTGQSFLTNTDDSISTSDTIYDEFQVHFLELGNDNVGDSVYIKADDVDILIDAGSKKDSAKTLCNYIDRYCTDGVLEYVIATHAHQDHIAGFVGEGSGTSRTGIFYQYEIGTLIDFSRKNTTSTISKEYATAVDYLVSKHTKHYTASQCFLEVDGAKKTFAISENASVSILYNYYYFNDDDSENNYSVCTLFSYQKENPFYALFTGDLELKGEEKLADYYNGSTKEKTLPKCQLFKAGHHGSKTSSNDCLLKIIQPQICCICTCAGTIEYTANYQSIFPTQDFVNRIAKYTDKVYVTSIYNQNSKKVESMNGNITISSDGTEIHVSATNDTTILKDTKWFNEEIYVKSGKYISSGAGKTDFYDQNTKGVTKVKRRVWPNSE